jgi:transcriptional regulator with XRE-family HTH domain
MPPANSLGQEIRRLRVAAGLTLAELSRRSALREAYLGAIEDGREEPSAQALRRVAQQLEPGDALYERLAPLLRQSEFDAFGRSSAEDTAPRLPSTPIAGATAPDAGEDTPVDETAGLQLERAEFDDSSPGSSCALCAQPLIDAYFQVNGRVVCPNCCERLRAHVQSGSGWVRAARATGAGLLAAAAGTILYFAMLSITGYEIGLIAIVVGVMVGKAVSWGSHGRGGWKYQTLAMVLTYLSIVTSYLPIVIRGMAKNAAVDPAAHATVVDPSRQIVGETSAERTASETRTPSASRPRQPLTFGGAVLATLLLILFACAIPFLMGLPNAIGIAIIGIGVYEAWKFNRRASFVVSGPHSLTAAAAPSAV